MNTPNDSFDPIQRKRRRWYHYLADFSGTGSMFREFLDFLWERKVWWMAPIVVVLLLLAVLIFVGGQSAFAPMIYTIF